MFSGDPRSVNQAAARQSTPWWRGGRPLRQPARWWLARLHAACLPARCLLCDAPGLRLGAWPGPVELCADCRSGLPANGAPGNGPPLRAPPPFALACVPWAYAWPVSHMVRALKFAGERSHARLFGTLLAAERASLGPPWPELVVPVPLHALRLRERGYNQAAEIARHAATACGRPLRIGALVRLRATREQSALGAARRARNVAGAFGAGGALAGLRVALVDDVVTTGSTAAAAAAALLAAGASSVELWAVARAQRRARSVARGVVDHQAAEHDEA